MSELERGFHAIARFATPDGMPLVLQDLGNLPMKVIAEAGAEIPATWKAEKLDNGSWKLTVNGQNMSTKDGLLSAVQSDSDEWVNSVRNDTSGGRDPIATVELAQSSDASLGWAVNGESEKETVKIRQLESKPRDRPVTELFKVTPPNPSVTPVESPTMPRPMANLPLWERYQAAHVAIDNLMQYLQAFCVKDAPCGILQKTLEEEIRPFIEGLQKSSAIEHRGIFKDVFPCKSLEIELTDQSRERAKERILPLVEQAEAALEELKEWAMRTGIEDLRGENIDATIHGKGEAIWAAAFKERQERVNNVIARFTYNGKPLGYVGSMSTGFRGPHKGKTHFDPNDFDVDLYVIDAQEYERERALNPDSRFMDGDKIFPSEEETPHLMSFSIEVANALAEEFPGVENIVESTVVLRRVPPW